MPDTLVNDTLTVYQRVHVDESKVEWSKIGNLMTGPGSFFIRQLIINFAGCEYEMIINDRL